MKSLIIILISFLIFSYDLDDSEAVIITHSIVDSGNVWYISEYPNSCRSCIRPHKIVFGEDTIIKSNTYKAILDYRGDSLESECKANTIGYMRETSDKKVYWHVGFFGRNASDILLYDFNAQINDTIDNWIVTKIDTVNILNINRKRLTLKNCSSNEKYWIDGIGNMVDLLSYNSQPICDYKTGIVGMISGGGGYRLNCVKQANNFIYKDSLASDCWIYKEY